MGKRGIQIVISGFSGAGKGTVVKKLLSQYDNYTLSISATTRKPRTGEEHGREYFFETKEEFEDMIEKDKLIEYAQYVGNYYGTPKEYVEEQLEQGQDVILEIELQGALKIKERFPEALLIFVFPPNARELETRLIKRGTEEADVIASRLSRAYEEADGVGQYDYLVVNDDLDACVAKMHQIVQSEHARVFRNQELLVKIKDELKGFSKGE